MRIGTGYDIHRLVEERKLILCGIEIPYVKGLISYTDGDVVLHAVADAILGALAIGDIGKHFPNSDAKYKGASSRDIIKEVVGILAKSNYVIGNIDTTIVAEEPKIHPFRDKMRESLAGLFGVSLDKINIKATTNEGVGALGRGDAIAAYAVVLLEEKR